MRERHPTVGLVTEEEGRKEKPTRVKALAQFVRRERENNMHGVYHLLLQLVVFPVDQNHSFLENWGEKTQRRLSWKSQASWEDAGWMKANVLDATRSL